MKIASCNNCGGVWEDTNPGKESIEYPDDTPVDGVLEQLKEVYTEGMSSKDIYWYWGCPVCKDDGYLTDNKKEDQ